LLVHRWPLASRNRDGARFTGVSTPVASTQKAGVQALLG
jgi:hypothetical protein